MDLGKMLAEALALDYPDGFHRRESGEYVIDAWIDLDAAAEAFLAKVREAEATEFLRSREGKGLEFAGNSSGAVSGEPFRMPHYDSSSPMRGSVGNNRHLDEWELGQSDHTGPVPDCGEVE